MKLTTGIRWTSARGIAISLLLAGCNQFTEPTVDQCLRREIFTSCMASLPAGPAATKYNDWDEVVSSCENVAYYQALRKKELIKLECRA